MDSLEKELVVDGKKYNIFALKILEEKTGQSLSSMPKSLKIILENLMRYQDGKVVTQEDVETLAGWVKNRPKEKEIAYHPARVLMQDFTGVPAVVDLAVMREAMVELGGDPKKINPLCQVDLVIDHSVSVEKFGTDDAFKKNVDIEYQRNQERYSFLRWGQKAFQNFRVVPPGTGICHQVNLEYLGQVVWTKEVGGKTLAFPDTLVGTDSHTTMINGLSILGWGVGGIEAEAAMLGQPISMLIPDVVGFKLDGQLSEGVTATDLVLTIVEILRKQGVVGKFVEFYGEGLDHLTLADRATIANMAPEYGATCGIFPIDQETINFLSFTARDPHQVKLVEAYAKEQGLWRNDQDNLQFTDTVELDISTVKPSIAGPKRPQDRIVLENAHSTFSNQLKDVFKETKSSSPEKVEGESFEMDHGHVAIAAITSCTNTSNPTVMVAAGLVAKKAIEKGLKVAPWVKTSLAPGSQVVSDYLEASGLQSSLDELGFNLVGYGCTTCIGNSGPLPEKISKAIKKGNLVACSVLSGNRNFEGRVNPDIRANYLASPPLVVAYAIAGSLTKDVLNGSLGKDKNGKDVFLKDIWPSNQEVKQAVQKSMTTEMFKARYGKVFEGDEMWQSIKVKESDTYNWEDSSTFIKAPPFFTGMQKVAPTKTENVMGAKTLLMLGDSVTTDHISPAGEIAMGSPAANYLTQRKVEPFQFNSYGSRRGNHEVMMRGTFANIRIRNEMLKDVEGGQTTYIPSGEQMSVYDAAMKYIADKTPLVVIAGKEYGTGSSRDWAAKGTRLLGVKAVIAESFERIHRSNLIGMGVLPLQFKEGENRKTLKLTGKETFDILGLDQELSPRMNFKVIIHTEDGSEKDVSVLCRIDTEKEMDYFLNSGILHFVLRKLNK